MSAPTGIQTYNSAPVNANKEEEGTHATTSQPKPATAIESLASAPSQPPSAPATTTATATAPSNPAIHAIAEPTSSQPAPPQPGATAVQPTPTATAAPESPPPPTSSLPETATAASTTQTPPAPQPGALPSPSTAYTGAAAAAAGAGTGVPAQSTSPIPPPPKAGETISQPPPQAAQPTQSYAQSYSYNAPTLGAQTAIPNSSSSPYSSVYQTQAGAYARPQPQGLPPHYGVGAGAGSGGGADSIFPEEEEGFMGAAKGWMRWSGNKLAEVEKGVWKKINDVHD
ncbi:hypothetical protein VN97_g7700 [Penicillium thymicola]|uniref:Uncharacterized protein n=1 Tax=Penicillium thymicola TaxID=293382 RepID=A0AAI9TE34_PENTH|nr:hypothetical protein VN97_g7700 [Penicillium thymicola]